MGTVFWFVGATRPISGDEGVENSTETQQTGQRSDVEVVPDTDKGDQRSDVEVVPDTARRRGSNAGQSRR